MLQASHRSDQISSVVRQVLKSRRIVPMKLFSLEQRCKVAAFCVPIFSCLRVKGVRLGLVLLIVLTSCSFSSRAANEPNQVLSVQKNTDGVTLKLQQGTLRLQIFSPRVIRVLYTRGVPGTPDGTAAAPGPTSSPEATSLSVITQPAAVSWQLIKTSRDLRVRTAALETRVERTTGAVSFYDEKGNSLLTEGQRSLTPNQIGNFSTLKSRQEFVLPKDEAFYGLGQHQAGLINYRDSIVHLQQENMKVAIPFLVSSRGYGVLWDNPAVTDVNLGAGEERAIPANQLFTDAGTEGGLTGHYFKDEQFATTLDTRTDVQINFDWTTAPPAGLPHDHYSIRWTGSLSVNQAGPYTFFVCGDDGVRLWIDDKLLVDDWNSHSAETHVARISLAANTRHQIRLDYYQSRNAARVQLAWAPPSLPQVVSWSSESATAIDYYFMYGPELDSVIASYRQLTGPAPLFGKWAWGFWQCKERYKSQQELLDVVAEYRKHKIPIDGIIQDWQYWAPAPWGSHEFDPTRYPDPARLTKQLHAAHTHLLISVWPKFDPRSENAVELRESGGVYPQVITYMGDGQWLDPFNPTARRIYWRQISKKLFRYDIDGWWLDGSEPELNAKTGEYREFTTAAGPGARVNNAYPLMLSTAVYQGQRAETNNKRVFILTRSAYAGQQRNAAVTWSGDIRGNWDVFRNQIPAGINFSLSGIPYWNTDTGGFFGIDPDEAGSRELFTRWFQYSAFCPMFRVHGTDKPKEMWRFDEGTEKILIAYDELRYHLLPYIYSVSWNVTHKGSSMMRGLVMDFRQDPRVADIPDQYLFGPALMISPVTKPAATTRSVYLPAGANWIDFWSGKSYNGGQTIDALAPIERLPLFVRAGSILPYGPAIQYALEKADPIELRVYRGANGSFTLYEDEGDNYNYEKGSYASIPISWNETKRMLTIGKRQGTFPGMLRERTFRIVWVGQEHGSGINNIQNADDTIRYDGSAVTVAPAR